MENFRKAAVDICLYVSNFLAKCPWKYIYICKDSVVHLESRANALPPSGQETR